MDVTVRLVDIDEDNWMEIVLLTTSEDGNPMVCEEYVASNALSICQAIFEEGWEVKAVYCGKKAIGFVMYGFNEKQNYYEICRLMIDRKQQGRGFGKIALRLVVEEMVENYEDCSEIYLSVNPGNKKGIRLYEDNGFENTGMKNGIEDIYCLYLEE